MKYKLWLIGHNTKHFIGMTWLRVKSMQDDTWLGIVFTTTIILLAIGASDL